MNAAERMEKKKRIESLGSKVADLYWKLWHAKSHISSEMEVKYRPHTKWAAGHFEVRGSLTRDVRYNLLDKVTEALDGLEHQLLDDCTVCGGEGWLPSLPEGDSDCPYCEEGKDAKMTVMA